MKRDRLLVQMHSLHSRRVCIARTAHAICSCSIPWQMLSGYQNVAKFNNEDRDHVNVHLFVARLQNVRTDVCIFFNQPLNSPPTSESPTAVDVSTEWEEGSDILASIAHSLQVLLHPTRSAQAHRPSLHALVWGASHPAPQKQRGTMTRVTPSVSTRACIAETSETDKRSGSGPRWARCAAGRCSEREMADKAGVKD